MSLFARLRELLHPSPSHETWQDLLSLLDAWPNDDTRQVALDYTRAHLEHWPPSLRKADEFTPQRPHWPLVQIFSSMYEQDPHTFLPHVQALHQLHIPKAHTLLHHPNAHALSHLQSLYTDELNPKDLQKLTSLIPQLQSLRFAMPEKKTPITTLHPLSQLSSLQSLEIFLNPSSHDLSAISTLHQLKHLTLHFPPHTPLPQHCFEAFQPLTQLQTLTLNNPIGLKDLQPLGPIHSLKHLQISNAQQLRSLDGLQLSPQLEQLSIARSHHLSKSPRALKPLLELHRLKRLQLQDSPIHALQMLRNCTQLEHLTLSPHPKTTLSHLSTLTQLEEVILQPQSSKLNIDPSPLSQLQKLQKLSVALDDPAALLPFAHHPSLRSLDLSFGTFSSLKGIPPLPSLKQLTIHCAYSLRSLDGIHNLSQLTHLDLESCERLTSIRALQHPTLKDLQLDHCTSLPSLDGLQHSPRLERLSLLGCRQLGRIDAIASLQKLNSVDLSGCIHVYHNPIPTLSIADIHPQLETLAHMIAEATDLFLDRELLSFEEYEQLHETLSSVHEIEELGELLSWLDLLYLNCNFPLDTLDLSAFCPEFNQLIRHHLISRTEFFQHRTQVEQLQRTITPQQR